MDINDSAMEDIMAAALEQELLDNIPIYRKIAISNAHTFAAELLRNAGLIVELPESHAYLLAHTVKAGNEILTDATQHIAPPDYDLMFLMVDDEVIAQLVAEDPLYQEKIEWGGVPGPYFISEYSPNLIRSHHSHLALFEQISHSLHSFSNTEKVVTKEQFDINRRALVDLAITWKTINDILAQADELDETAIPGLANLRVIRDRVMGK